ncbi:uncharacterized protein VTP21DRAFT_5512 [Calcarisporiella thermophila]|uniref:uncharacterized protein n=1 Tax=Calcarisporiella thermophila TaxID=911321 RepID=UPI003742E090
MAVVRVLCSVATALKVSLPSAKEHKQAPAEVRGCEARQSKTLKNRFVKFGGPTFPLDVPMLLSQAKLFAQG